MNASIEYSHSGPAGSGGGLVIIGANDGLSFDTGSGNIQLGQTVGEAGNPAALLQNRQIPMAGFNIQFTGGGTVFIGTPPTLSYSPTTLAVPATSQLGSIYLSDAIPTLWSEHAGINSVFRDVTLGNQDFGDLIEELTSVFIEDGFRGYAGMYSTPYMFAATPVTPDPAAYHVGYSSLPVYDNAGGAPLPILAGYYSALNNNNGPVANAYDFIAHELNSVNRVPNAPDVTNHYVLYCGALTKATNNYGVYMDGLQLNYFGGNVGAHQNAPTAFLHSGPSTGAAGTAPLKIDPGALMPTPEQGAIENDGNDFYMTNAPGRGSVLLNMGLTASIDNITTDKIQVNIGGTVLYIFASTSPL